jgi:hypothetical protein
LKAKDLEKRLTNQMKDMEKLLKEMHKSVTSELSNEQEQQVAMMLSS